MASHATPELPSLRSGGLIRNYVSLILYIYTPRAHALTERVSRSS